MTAHEQEKSKQAAELARIKERMTLKTHKASKWAHELLLNKRVDSEFRSGISAQVKEQLLLREHIMGKADGYKAADEGSDDGGDTQKEQERAELERIQEDLDIRENEYRQEPKQRVVGRRKFGGLQVKPDPSNEEELDGESDDQNENSNLDAPIKTITKPPIEPAIMDCELQREECDGDEQVEEDVNERQNTLNSMRARFERNKKLADLIFSARNDNDLGNDDRLSDSNDSEFEREKDKLVAADAPKTEDVTLPGWGCWSGPGVSSVNAPTIKVLKHTPGIDPKKRKDSQLHNVIISEKKLPGMDKFTVPNVPMPFANRQQYETHLQAPLGPEWNSEEKHRKMIKPRVIVPAGSIIKAPKLPQLNYK